MGIRQWVVITFSLTFLFSLDFIYMELTCKELKSNRTGAK